MFLDVHRRRNPAFLEAVVERIARLLHPVEAPVTSDTTASAIASQVLQLSGQHVAGITAEHAAEFSAELGESGTATRSLTAGTRA